MSIPSSCRVPDDETGRVHARELLPCARSLRGDRPARSCARRSALTRSASGPSPRSNRFERVVNTNDRGSIERRKRDAELLTRLFVDRGRSAEQALGRKAQRADLPKQVMNARVFLGRADVVGRALQVVQESSDFGCSAATGSADTGPPQLRSAPVFDERRIVLGQPERGPRRTIRPRRRASATTAANARAPRRAQSRQGKAPRTWLTSARQ